MLVKKVFFGKSAKWVKGWESYVKIYINQGIG